MMNDTVQQMRNFCTERVGTTQKQNNNKKREEAEAVFTSIVASGFLYHSFNDRDPDGVHNFNTVVRTSQNKTRLTPIK